MPRFKFKKGDIPWNKDKSGYKTKPCSEERKRKISKALKGKYVSEETKRKISENLKNNKKFKIALRNKKRGKKISKARRKEWQLGTRKGGWKWTQKSREAKSGILLSKEIKGKIRQGCIKYWDKIGRKNYKRYHHQCRTKKYKEWRKKVFTRDDFTCRNCEKVGGYLIAHHIKSWAHYPKLRYDINNGLSLCKKCHKLTSNYKGKAIK